MAFAELGTCVPGPDAGAIPPISQRRGIFPGFGLLSLAILYSRLNMRPMVKGFPAFASFQC